MSLRALKIFHTMLPPPLPFFAFNKKTSIDLFGCPMIFLWVCNPPDFLLSLAPIHPTSENNEHSTCPNLSFVLAYNAEEEGKTTAFTSQIVSSVCVCASVLILIGYPLRSDYRILLPWETFKLWFGRVFVTQDNFIS